MRRIGRSAAKCAVCLFALGLVFALLGALVLRTAPGRRLLLRTAVPLLNGRMAGRLTIEGIEGDVPSHFVLRNARLDDAEGFEAIFARRVEVWLDWRQLLHRHIAIEDVRVEGARLTLRHLRDNRLNLAALKKPAPPIAQKNEQAPPQRREKSPQPPPLVTLAHFHVQLEGAYFPPRGHETQRLDWPRGTFDIDGAAWFRGADMHFSVAHFLSDSREPLRAHVELHGGLRVEPHKVRGHTQFTFEKVSVTVETEGSELARLSPLLRARGHWSAAAEGGGPLTGLRARVVVSAPAGHIAVAGELGRLFPGVRWQALVDATGIDPGADWQSLPSGNLALALRGAGAGRQGEVVLEQLTGTLPGLVVRAAGHSDLAGRGEGQLRAHVADLGRLWPPATGTRRLPGAVERLSGAVDLVATLARDRDGPRLSAQVNGRLLGLRQARLDARVAALTAALELAPRQAPRFTLRARDLALAPASIERAREKLHGVAGALPPTPTTTEAPGASSAAARTPPYVTLATLALVARGRPASLWATLTATTATGAHGIADLHASLWRGGGRARIDRLALQTRHHEYHLPSPAQLQLAVAGAETRFFASVAGARADGKVTLGRQRFAAALRADVPELARLTPSMSGALALDGQIVVGETLRVVGHVDTRRLRAGPLAIARATLAVDTHDLAGTIALGAESLSAGTLALGRLDARLHADGAQLRLDLAGEGRGAHVLLAVAGRWHTRKLTLVSADLVLERLELALPHQAWTLAHPARLTVGDAGVALAGLEARSGLGRLQLDARLFPSRAIDVTLQLRDGELQELGRLFTGRGDVLPPARWSGRVRARGTLAAPLVDASLTARAERTVAWYGLAFNALALEAFGDQRHAILHVEARGQDENRITFDAHATPVVGPDGPRALAATIDRVQVTVNQHGWALRRPCQVQLDSSVTIEACTLGSGRAEVAINGVVPLSATATQPLALMVATRRLDLRDLGALAAPGHKEPPKTSFDARLHLTGTRARPTIDLELAGTGSQVDEGLPENVRYQIRAHYADGRIVGQASLRQVGVRLGIGAQFDLPLHLDGPEQPIALELEARPVPFFKMRNLLPPSLANLQGFFTLRLRADGTTRHPHLSGELHAPSWGLADLRDNDTIVDVAYDGQELTLNSVTSFQATTLLASILRIRPKRNNGTIKLAARLPLDLVQLIRAPRRAMAALAHDAPLTASAELRAVDLTKVPLQVAGLSPWVTSGTLDGAARLTGTLRAPSLHAELRAREVARPGTLRHLDVDAALAWERGRADVSGHVRLGSAPLFSWRGNVTVDGTQLFGGDVGAAALAIDVDAPSLPLGAVALLQPRLHGLAGVVRGHVALRGTVGAPSLIAHVEGADLQLGQARFARAAVDAAYGARAWHVGVTAREQAGGTLRLDGTVPRDRDRPLDVTLAAAALDIGFATATWEELGELHGTLDARLALHGTRAVPRLDGHVRLTDARLGLRWDPRRYTGGTLDLVFAGDTITLRRFALDGGGGTLAARGRLLLDDDGVPARVELAAQARSFIAAYGSASAWLDADFTLGGDRVAQRWNGTLTLQRGTIKLPDLDGGEPILSHLPDVELVDKRAPEPRHAPTMTLLTRVDHPLELRSKEVQMRLVGELAASFSGGQRRLEGVVEGDGGGTMELLGHRYEVERAQLAFTGPPDDPELHLRATRKLAGALLSIIIEGTAKTPSVRLQCDPPIYDEVQLTSLVLAGRPNEERVAVRDLEARVAGLLSALVIRKIEQQLAPSLPIDVVRPLDQQSYAELSQAPLEVGRFVTDRIYVSYAQRAGSRMGRSAANVEEARAEYRLGGGWELDTTFGDAGVGGIYLMWTARH